MHCAAACASPAAALTGPAREGGGLRCCGPPQEIRTCLGDFRPDSEGGGEGARLHTDVVEAVAEGKHEGNVPADHRLGLAADRAVRDRERCGAGGRVGADADRIIMEIVKM